MVRRGPRVLVLSGPSGSGKSSLLRLLFEEFPEKFGFSVSHTTRNPRPGEEDGKHYHFTTKEYMEAAVARGDFIESAVFSNNMYGTSVAAVKDVCKTGKVCVLDIDIQGVKQLKQTNLDPILLFIKPPSMTELEKRLRNRGTENEDSLQKRLDTARSEIAYGDTPGNFDLVLKNDNLEKAYSVLRDFVLKELDKRQPSDGQIIYQNNIIR
uniref:guanylate kinase n=2 Tax=Clastoptera arizonana TaxID=38151 RepID=A0A1B6DS88_9HEMI